MDKKARFKIEYQHPEGGWHTIYKTFERGVEINGNTRLLITPRDYAEQWAYSQAQGGLYIITEVSCLKH